MKKINQIKKPSWADGFGEDDHGVFASFLLGPVEFEFRWIPPGRFLMGSPLDELGRWNDEGPQARREVAGFWLATTPVTQEQWLALRAVNPSHYARRGRYPVESVDWQQAVDFARELAEKASMPLRLPTEAEWEYACRAGATAALYSGKELMSEYGACANLDELGWYDENSGSSSHEVGGKLPNAWGLHDMLGNVWEWCADLWDERAYEKVQRGDPAMATSEGVERVVRGGSWNSLAGYCRAASRFGNEPENRGLDLGFRLAAGQDLGQKDARGGARKGAGRRPKPPGEKLKTRAIRATDTDWNRFQAAANAEAISHSRLFIKLLKQLKKDEKK